MTREPANTDPILPPPELGALEPDAGGVLAMLAHGREPAERRAFDEREDPLARRPA